MEQLFFTCILVLTSHNVLLVFTSSPLSPLSLPPQEVLRTSDPYAPQSDDISSSRSGIVQGLLYVRMFPTPLHLFSLSLLFTPSLIHCVITHKSVLKLFSPLLLSLFLPPHL